jgi:hypothetical protein
MQFNSKVESTSSTKSSVNNLQAGEDTSDLISLKKMLAPTMDKQGNDSLFSGGESIGNSVAKIKKEDKPKEQSVQKSSTGELIIAYNDKEIFIQKNSNSKVKQFISQEIEKNKDAKFEISIAYPSSMASTTMKKQISVARALNIKNSIKKMNVKLSNMKLNMKFLKDKKYKNGFVKIRVIK